MFIGSFEMAQYRFPSSPCHGPPSNHKKALGHVLGPEPRANALVRNPLFSSSFNARRPQAGAFFLLSKSGREYRNTPHTTATHHAHGARLKWLRPWARRGRAPRRCSQPNATNTRRHQRPPHPSAPELTFVPWDSPAGPPERTAGGAGFCPSSLPAPPRGVRGALVWWAVAA